MTISSMIIGMLITGFVLLLAGWTTDALRVHQHQPWKPNPGDTFAYQDYSGKY